MDSTSFSCPTDMVHGIQAVMNGEYDVPVKFAKPPLIVDIGANVGGFTVWASRRWKGAKLVCYEPIPDNFAMLKANVEAFKIDAELINAAVVHGMPGVMFRGLNNCGECSFFDLGEQRTWAKRVKVETVAPSSVPKCDILKIDTEGCELMILEGYKHQPRIVLLEWHSIQDRKLLKELLIAKGYRLLEETPFCAERGIQKFILDAKTVS